MDLIIREFEKRAVRMINENGEVYFVAADVAKLLGYKNTSDAIKEHCRGVVKRYRGVETGKKADGSPAIQKTAFNMIPESDVYRLIFRSKLPAAAKFEDWVTKEVLPSIRKNGAYIAPNADMAGVINALLEAQEKRIEAKCAELSAVRTENQLLNFFRPVGKPGDVSSKTSEEKWRFRRGYFCSGDRGKHVSLLLQHPDQPDLFETFEVTQ